MLSDPTPNTATSKGLQFILLPFHLAKQLCFHADRWLSDSATVQYSQDVKAKKDFTLFCYGIKQALCEFSFLMSMHLTAASMSLQNMMCFSPNFLLRLALKCRLNCLYLLHANPYLPRRTFSFIFVLGACMFMETHLFISNTFAAG